MAELVVQSQYRSQLRQTTDTILNVGFPIWGIVSPIAIIGLLLQLTSFMQMTMYAKVWEILAYLAVCICFSVTCLLLKRLVVLDIISVDKQGIRLPRLMGLTINFRTYIPWNSIQQVAAVVPLAELAPAAGPVPEENPGLNPHEGKKRRQLVITKKHGAPLRINLKHLQPDFVEQFLLAAQMWAPDVCDLSLKELQDRLRISAQNAAHASYTELWEEELGRRFCPTSYVPLETGQVLRNSSLKVLNHLSSGGLSALYLCQLDGKQLVVLKEAVIPESGAENVREKAKEMFDREAHLLMKLDHQGIVHVLDFFSEGERNYLLLEYINGIDLRQLVKQNGQQREADVLEWAVQIAVSLKYLHEREQPVIHRDLTPDNIVLRNDGQVVIVDFGAANEFIGTATGTFVGKHSFIAPEQLRGKATVQSDIYAFGCTLFFLLTGTEPEALSASNPKELEPSVSDELCELVESCTQLDAGDRYQSVAQLIPVLRRLAAQSMVS